MSTEHTTKKSALDIVINNPPSAGAHFSRNTNRTILELHKWLLSHESPVRSLKQLITPFTRDVVNPLSKGGKHYNYNNLRNICTLLNNGGLVRYRRGHVIIPESFFTKRGLAYIELLRLKTLIKQNDSYTEEQKNEASQHIEVVRRCIIYNAIRQTIQYPIGRYSPSLYRYLLFLSKFGKADQLEFAVMIHYFDQDESTWEEKTKPIIEKYRNGQIDINVQVEVRNDEKNDPAKTRGKPAKTKIADIRFFSAYKPLSKLVHQAGLTEPDGDYYRVVENHKIKLEDLIKLRTE